MVGKIKQALMGPPLTDEAYNVAATFLEAIFGKAIYGGRCPYAAQIKQHGTLTRVFNGTRTDN
jgi:hypothetical protein